MKKSCLDFNNNEMAFREWEQDFNGTWSLDCSKEIHDSRMACDTMYRDSHINKIEAYKEIPWILRSGNRGFLTAAILAVALGTGAAVVKTIGEKENSQQVK